jgi:tetratricopeptide (TPR) repeat protein
MDFPSLLRYKKCAMLRILRGLARLPLFDKRQTDPDSVREERWSADFSHPRKARFTTGEEAAYETLFEDEAYVLRLKKGDCLAWAEDPLYRYEDLVAEASIRFNDTASYAAAGLLFRCADQDSYYAVLVSTKGYLRIDAVFNGSPMPLVGWTELPGSAQGSRSNDRAVESFKLRVISFSDRITVTINDLWAAEVTDGTLSSGRLAFALASYESAGGVSARLESLKLESRPIEVEAAHLRWNSLIRVDPAARARLAETFAAMGQPMSALIQLKRAGTGRSQAELLLAADCAMRLSLLREAEDYLDDCVEIDPDTDEARRATAEKAKILYLGGRYAELKDHAEEAISLFPSDPTLRALLGHAYWNLGSADRAAAAYDEALRLDPDNGLIARNAAQAYERIGNQDQAFQRYLEAGRAFLAAENYEELAFVEPRLLELRKDDPASHALAGKRAFALEDWKRAETELALAARLQAERGDADEDSAVPYLRALLLTRAGKRKEALPLLERAVQLEADYAPYRFRLAECRFLLNHNPKDPKLASDLYWAIELAPEDGWVANLAGQIALARGDLDEAGRQLDRAAAVLDGEPSVRANRAELAFLKGDAEGALDILTKEDHSDPEGILATELGNILVRLGRYEEADEAYAKAIHAAPGDVEYLRNRASCLIELSRYGEADELLSKAFDLDPSPRTLELTAYVAVKKGELPRAEAACRLALELKPDDTAILASLAWTYLSMSRWKGAEEAIARLEASAKPNSDDAASAAELRERLLEATTRKVSCASCGRTWRVLKDVPTAAPLRLVAEPPDDLPAGTCPRCLKTYCIACAKAHLTDGRFACPECGERLKLLDEGLKKLLADWAASTAI